MVSYVGKQTKLKGKMSSPQEIINASIMQLTELWGEALSNDYMLHIEYTYYEEGSEDKLLIDHYLFGDVDWNSYDNTKWNKQNTFHITAKLSDVKRLIDSKPFFASENKNSKGFEKDRLDLTLLSNDLIYAFDFSITNGNPHIKMNLSSAIFNKGTHYGYIVATYFDGTWTLSTSFDRAKKYKGFQGALLQCAQHIFEQENEMEHPYQYMIDNHPDVYRDATKYKRRFI